MADNRVKWSVVDEYIDHNEADKLKASIASHFYDHIVEFYDGKVMAELKEHLIKTFMSDD